MRPDLYVIDPGTGELTRFLTGPGSQTNAESSPDGERVVYESRLPATPSQIFVVGPDGATRQLTHMEGGASDPTWSPDGTQIAFAGIRPRPEDPWPNSDIFVMNADGSRIHRFAGTPDDDGHPDWSPDGSRIAFHSRSAIGGMPGGTLWLASVATRSLTRLTGSHTPMARVDPAWSADGRWIAYSEIARSTLNGRVYTTWLGIMRPNGTHRRRVEKSVTYNLIENPSWSPDGRSIVFEENDPPAVGVRWDGSVGDVGIIDVRRERTGWIVTSAASDQPSWGSDGILVSLSSDEEIVQTVWAPRWSRPDATVELTGSRCELDGGPRVIDPGVLAIEFVNRSYREAYMRVVRLRHGRRLADLRPRPFIGGRWVERNAAAATDVWSSPRAVAPGRWAVACFKDLIDGSNGFHIVPAGVAGPIEIG
jgi:Tol biopolymer transport system component